MNSQEIEEVLKKIDDFYPRKECYLEYSNAYELLFATIMSAQCKDDRVNEVTKTLYVKYPSLKSFAEADLSELEEDIHSVGFYHNKAKNIIGAARMLLSDYDGEVPSDIYELVKLPGVGRKTANVIRGNIFHIPSIVVDTHVKRTAKLIGLTLETDPEKVEMDLYTKIPSEHQIRLNVQLMALGREFCVSGRPKCSECFLRDICFHNTHKHSD
ncbi:MAG: endonuclease III [Lachnospiraceae bacterium]|nr:endonuclease III [Lachnospiraceae bacterium]